MQPPPVISSIRGCCLHSTLRHNAKSVLSYFPRQYLWLFTLDGKIKDAFGIAYPKTLADNICQHHGYIKNHDKQKE